MEEPPVFRAVKRRKHIHKQDSPDPAAGVDDETPSQLIKLRTLPRARLKGVQFTNQKTYVNEPDNLNMDLYSSTAGQQDSELHTHYGINNRFVGSATGQVVNVDKHMMAYVDQQMAKKHSNIPTTSSSFSRHHTNSRSQSNDNNEDNDDNDDDASVSTSTSDSPSPQPAPPSQHHNITSSMSFQPLAEVDLSAQNTTNSSTTTPKPPRRKGPRRPRLGRDGKPLRPRARKRRDSDDIARDGLVEQVLHENAPYGPDGGGVGTNTHKGAEAETETKQQRQRQGNNEALDEKMAMEFQRQFLDAATERRQMQQHRSSSNNAKAGGAAVGKTKTGSATNPLLPQGPRLGGSRNARARIMAAAQAAATAAAAKDDDNKGGSGK